MLKVDFHTHTADDPVDAIPYSTVELIDRAADLEFDAVAITLHDRQLDIRTVADYATSRGVLLISGVERTILGRHVVLLNFPSVAESVEDFDAVRRLKDRFPDGLVIAPHPFFPHGNCLRERLTDNADLVDAVEVNAFYTTRINYNRRATRWAREHGKPLVGNSDVHRLSLLGRTCTFVEADRTPDAICAAVRAGRVRIDSQPISTAYAAWYFGSLTVAGILPHRYTTRAARLRPLDSDA
jgi:predicted metal-dependent phosphoesterase TrpH